MVAQNTSLISPLEVWGSAVNIYWTTPQSQGVTFACGLSTPFISTLSMTQILFRLIIIQTTMHLFVSKSAQILPVSLNKTLLIYRGLPSFLNFALSNSILYNQSVLTHQSQLNQNSISTTNIRANLFLSLTGDRLLDNPLVVVNGYDVVTLVYLYHGTGMDRAALNVSVTVWNGDNSSDLNQVSFNYISTVKNK